MGCGVFSAKIEIIHDIDSGTNIIIVQVYCFQKIVGRIYSMKPGDLLHEAGGFAP